MEEAKNKEMKQQERIDEKETEKVQQPSAKDKDRKEEQELVRLDILFSFRFVRAVVR